MSTATFEVVDDDLWQDLVDRKLDFDQFLFLEPHKELVRYWKVEGHDPVFEARLGDALPRFGAISVFDWENFSEVCTEKGYRPVFMEDPSPIFEWKDSLSNDPGVEIRASFEGRLDRNGDPIVTVRGFLPFQAQGVNYMRSCERAGYGQWSTGTGKSVLAEAMILLKQSEGFDLTLYVNKPGNLYNAQRKIQDHILESIDSTVLAGTPKVRERMLGDIEAEVASGKQPVLILNAEKFKSDKELLKEIVEDRRVLIIFDEMPFKYANRMTDLYRATSEVLYTSHTTRKSKKSFYPKAGKDRTKESFYLAMSATSMRNSPEDIFNCVTGDTEVEALGEVERFYRGWWKGPLVKLITTSGSMLTIGPNHPVLTRDGWVNAQFLCKGDQVVCRSGQIRPSGVEYLKQEPSRVEDLFDAARTTSQSVWSKRASSFEFHGDGKFFKSEIDIVDVDGLLASVGQARVVEQNCEPVFPLAHSDPESSFASQSPFHQRLLGITSPQSGLGASFSPVRRSVNGAVPRSKLDTRFPKPVGNQLLANTELFGDTESGSFILNVIPPHKIQIDIDSPSMRRAHLDSRKLEIASDGIGSEAGEIYDISNGFALNVELDEIVSVEVVEWDGYLYDLSASGSTYYANGIMTNNCVRMMDSRIFGSINDFHNAYVAARDTWGNVVRWRNLDYFGAKYSHIVHLADKYSDPRIAAQFPKILPAETIWCDLSEEQQKLYDRLQKEYANIGSGSVLDWDEILAALGVLQMIVDNPRAVLDSAMRREAYEQAKREFLQTKPSPKELRSWEKKNIDGSEVALKLRLLVGDDSKFTDRDKKGDCIISKMNRMREDIEENDEKVIVFSDKNDMVLPYIAEWFDKWGITYVTYHGNMTPKKRDEAQEEFRTNPEIKVFLSTDAGQDSIDLPEANLTCHYNDPWTKATKVQRGNRQHRIDSEMDSVREVTYRSPNTCEDHRATILQRKGALQEEVDGEIVEQADHMSREDFLFMLTGDSVHLD